MKERTRQLPGLPWRLRGAKRERPQAANPAAAAAVGAVAAADFVQVKPGGWPEAEVVRAAVLEDGSTVPGVHDLRPVGPWPPAGTGQARNGRLPGMWACSRCPKQASDSSRAGELAKKPCEQAEWQSTAATHVIVEAAGAWSCQRCKLEVRPQHAASAARATCPVPQLLRGGQAWPEGEASIRAVLGRVKGFRRWCCGDESAAAAAAAPDPPAARQPAEAAEQLEHRELACAVCLLVQCVCTGAGAEQAAKRARAAPVEEAGSSGPSLAAYRTHEAVVLGRALRCLRCFERPAGDYRAWKRGRCSGELPPQAMPGSMPCELVRVGTLEPGASRVAKTRFAELLACARQRPGQATGSRP